MRFSFFVSAAAVFTPAAPPVQRAETEQGLGVALGSIPNVAQRIERTKTSSPELRRLFSLCFPLVRGLPHKQRIKQVLKGFSGLTRDEQRQSARGKMRRMLKEEKPAVIGRLLLLMDIDFEEGKEREREMVDRVCAWLDKPEPTGRAFVSMKGKFADRKPKSRKRRKSSAGASASGGGSAHHRSSDSGGRHDSSSDSSGSGSSGSSDSSGSDSDSSDSSTRSPPRKQHKPSSSSSSSKSGSSSQKKRPAAASSSSQSGGKKRVRGRKDSGRKKNSMRTANSFVVFSSAKRDDVRAANPQLSVQEITSRLGVMWRTLRPDDKEVYELAAKRLRQDALKEEAERAAAEAAAGGGAAAPAETAGGGGGGDGEKAKKVKRSRPDKQKKAKARSSADKEETKSSGESGSDGSGTDGSGSESGDDSGTEDEDEAVKPEGAAESKTAPPPASSFSAPSADSSSSAVKGEEAKNGSEMKTGELS